jgi:hypothetical protein
MNPKLMGPHEPCRTNEVVHKNWVPEDYLKLNKFSDQKISNIGRQEGNLCLTHSLMDPKLRRRGDPQTHRGSPLLLIEIFEHFGEKRGILVIFDENHNEGSL